MDFDEFFCTSPELREIANSTVCKLLPEKSKAVYLKEYNNFMAWCEQNNTKNISENDLVTYFEIMSTTKKSSTMWANYSMLRACLSIYKDIDISKYSKLTSFLKRKGENYQPKKSKILETENVIKFISDAHDYTFLAMKAILIMGYCGACRRDELTRMRLDDVEIASEMIKVTVPRTRTSVSRVFLITELPWVAVIKKYLKLRPSHTPHNRFFLTYRRGKCVTSPMGINKIGEVPKIIATYLELSNPEEYTGQCFRRSSASHLATHGGNLFMIKKYGKWKCSSAAKGFSDVPLRKKFEGSHMLSNQPNTSTFPL